MEANVTLIVKAANQSVADYRIECDSDWTVLHLKNHLSKTHPSKPSVKEQRLIYSGQLLVDHLVLRNALRHPSENNSYTIHLVCSPPRNNTSPTVTNNSAATVNPATNMASAESSSPPAPVQGGGSNSSSFGTSTNQTPSESTAESTDSSTDGVRRRFVSPEVTTSTSTTTTTTIGGPTPYINPGAPQFPQELITTGADPMHQMAAMQQMYAQYMTSYMQYMQMGGAVSGMMWPGQMLQPATPMAPPPNPQVTVTTTATEPQEVPRVDNNAQPQPQQQQQQNQPQIRMNAQGGEVDEEDEGGEEGLGRDWLDWVYMASRCAVLLSIVYFYSTPSRFMLVICIAMLLYLYQAGWFRPARRIEAVPPREGNNNNVNRNDNNNQDDRNNNINNNNNNNNNLVNEVPQDINPDIVDGNADVQNPPTNEASDRVVEEVPARPSLLALSWTFLTTFFTSLIPEQPQIV